MQTGQGREGMTKPFKEPDVLPVVGPSLTGSQDIKLFSWLLIRFEAYYLAYRYYTLSAFQKKEEV